MNNPRTLSKKLNYLLSIGLIEVDENGYRLTEKGLEATKLMGKLNSLLKEPEVRITNVERIPHKFYGELLRKYSKILYNHYRERLLGKLMKSVKEKLTELGAKKLFMLNGRYYWIVSKVKAGEVYQL